MATGAGLQWRDSFHTGFVLRCLMEMEAIDPAIGTPCGVAPTRT